MLTDIEKKIIASIQGDIPIAPRPYRIIAESIGVTETEVIDTLHRLCQEGIIRRFGATLRHQKSGYAANAMGAWQVPEERVESVGRIMAGFREVSHCYRRNPAIDWPYNVYTMIHAKDEASCREIARRISEKTGINDYDLLFSVRELKKTSMRYFSHPD
jgi:siroheme decarboxylase